MCIYIYIPRTPAIQPLLIVINSERFTQIEIFEINVSADLCLGGGEGGGAVET